MWFPAHKSGRVLDWIPHLEFGYGSWRCCGWQSYVGNLDRFVPRGAVLPAEPEHVAAAAASRLARPVAADGANGFSEAESGRRPRWRRFSSRRAVDRKSVRRRPI